MTAAAPGCRGTVALVTLGCGRNEVDSEQVAGALAADGLQVVDDTAQADVVIVNTCSFIAPARQESVEAVVEACDDRQGRPVLVIGCMAQRHGTELAAALPEVAGVLGFADYPRLPAVVRALLRGDSPADAPATGPGTAPAKTLPLAPPGLPLAAPAAAPTRPPQAPPTAAFPVRTAPRGPWAYLKIAGGCDRVCTFCAIPSFRGRFASRPVSEVLAEARWLVAHGARELVCVSENTTSYGKDLPAGRRSLVDLLHGLEEIEGLRRVRLLYLQPAELQPALLDVMAASPVVAGYYDLSLQHASNPVLRRMARSGGAQRFLALVDGIRGRDPGAVLRSSFIVGFPGETEADVGLLERFLVEARLDWTGFFCFSPEEGTPAAVLPDHVPPSQARARRDRLVDVAEAVAEEAAAGFVGRSLAVLVEGDADGGAVGRSYREAPDSDGEVRLPGCPLPVGHVVDCRVVATDGVDLVAEPVAGTPAGLKPVDPDRRSTPSAAVRG